MQLIIVLTAVEYSLLDHVRTQGSLKNKVFRLLDYGGSGNVRSKRPAETNAGHL
jgi:hypothetical protein